MNDFKLNKLIFGKNDGKREAQLDDFENLFYDFDSLYYRAIDSTNFLVLGRKGTGKTLLAELIKKRADGVDNWICSLENYKKFSLEKLKTLKSETDMKADEYIPIWEWLILIELGKLLLGVFPNKDVIEYKILENFYMENNFGLTLNANKVLETTSERKIKGELGVSSLKAGGEAKIISKITKGDYLDYLYSLKEIILKLFLQIPNIKFTLMYDELDSKFKNEEEYKNSIISLVKASNDLNELFLKNKVPIKVMIFLRQDIFKLLNDYDLNKIKEDCSITIDWGTNVSDNSPLVEMIINKIKKSHSKFEVLDKAAILNVLFSDVKFYTTKGQQTFKAFDYMLTRTLLRPRDIVTYLNKIAEKYPEKEVISGEYIAEVEKLYSDYLFNEIKNELKGHLSDDEIDRIFLLLNRFSRRSFRYQDLEKYYLARKNTIGEINLQECISLLFKFGALGNVRYDKNGRKYYKWAYRENNIEINLEERLVIHLGLRKKFNLQ